MHHYITTSLVAIIIYYIESSKTPLVWFFSSILGCCDITLLSLFMLFVPKFINQFAIFLCFCPWKWVGDIIRKNNQTGFKDLNTKVLPITTCISPYRKYTALIGLLGRWVLGYSYHNHQKIQCPWTLLQKVKKTVHSPFEIDICFCNSFFKEYGCCQSVGRIVTLLNLRNKTGKERSRQTLCNKRDNNFVWKNFPPNVAFCQTDLFVKDQKKLPLSPATFVTNTRFAIELRKLTIITVTIVSIFVLRDRTY